jgi:cytochrome c oxidase assembly protein subunit 11
LNAGEERNMPMIFYIDPAIPKHLATVTLSYKFYNMADLGKTAVR